MLFIEVLITAVLSLAVTGGGQKELLRPEENSSGRLELEEVRGHLAEPVSDGLRMMVGESPPGLHLLVFDNGSSELRRFRDNGHELREPDHLGVPPGMGSRLEATRMAASRGGVGLAHRSQVSLFDPRGEFLCQDSFTWPVSGIAPFRDGEWIIGLTPLVNRELVERGFRYDPDRLFRVVVIDERCRVVREGLPAGDRSRTSANAAAGSALVFAPAGNRVWAAEIGSYRITELDRRLRPRRSLTDPILVLKDEPSDDPDSDRADPEGRRELEDRIDAMTRELGTDLARRRTDGPRPRGLAQMVEFPRVIRAVAWDNQLNRLLVLLGEGIDGEFGALDVLDPLKGEGQRYRLAFDPGSRQPQEPLAHMALTRRAIVFSSGRADSPAYRVYRLDRHQLHEREGTPIELRIEGEPSDEQDEPDDDS